MWDQAGNEQGRNFNNKMWNALKLVKMWEQRQQGSADEQETKNNFAITWFANRLNEVKAEVDELMKQFRLSEALKVIYSLIWDDFCSWYLEWVKPGFEQPIEAAVYKKTIGFFGELMQLLHPFMPFVTEEIYQQLQPRTTDLCITQLTATVQPDKDILTQGDLLKKVISSLRDARNKNQVKPKETIKLAIETDAPGTYKPIMDILGKQVNAEAISFTGSAQANSIVVAIEKEKFYITTDKVLDSSALKNDLLKDLEYQKNFLASVEKKLGNEKFVQNAKPEVIALERKKKADAEARIRTIEESLSTIS